VANVILNLDVRNARFCRTGSTKREAAMVEISRLTNDIEVKLFVVGAAVAISM
jgi:hypothetical protein